MIDMLRSLWVYFKCEAFGHRRERLTDHWVVCDRCKRAWPVFPHDPPPPM